MKREALHIYYRRFLRNKLLFFFCTETYFYACKIVTKNLMGKCCSKNLQKLLLKSTLVSNLCANTCRLIEGVLLTLGAVLVVDEGLTCMMHINRQRGTMTSRHSLCIQQTLQIHVVLCCATYFDSNSQVLRFVQRIPTNPLQQQAAHSLFVY